MKRPKYNNIKTEVDGVLFDSKKEARRYCELKILVKSGQISGLELQPRFECVVNGKKVCRYIADFAYIQGGAMVYEDVKGMKTPIYRLKKKLVEALHGVVIVEI